MKEVEVIRATDTVRGFELTATKKNVTVEKIVANAKGGSPLVAVWWPGNGVIYFSLNSGWGEKPVKNWRLNDDHLEQLRKNAREIGFKVKPKNTAPNPKRKGVVRPKSAVSEQLPLIAQDA